MYLITRESLKQLSQRNHWTESNDLHEKLAVPANPVSSMNKNYWLIHAFTVSSLKNANKYSFDILPNL